MDVRFMVYNVNGTTRGELPWPASWQMTTAFNEVPSLILEYPQTGPHLSLLNGACEIGLMLRDSGGIFLEPLNCRFLNIRRQFNRADPSTNIRYTMPGISWAFRKIRMRNRTGIGNDGRRYFNNTTIGNPLTTMIAETQPTNMGRLETLFSPGTDSQFEFWDEDSLNLGVAFGQDYLSFLDALSRQGLCDWAMAQWSLLVYNPDFGPLARNQVHINFIPGVDYSEDQIDITREDTASRVVLEGEGGAWISVLDGTADVPWGDWEHYISQPGLNRTADMVAFAQRAIRSMRQERSQITRTLVDKPRPWVVLHDYRPGDYITSAAASGTQGTRLRIHQVTLTSKDDGTVDTLLTLNDMFLDRAIRGERINNGLLAFGGPSVGGGTTGWRWR